MKSLHADIEIDAPAERVWQIVSDFTRYPEWNPFIVRAADILVFWCDTAMDRRNWDELEADLPATVTRVCATAGPGSDYKMASRPWRFVPRRVS